jgi:hypothetical protein
MYRRAGGIIGGKIQIQSELGGEFHVPMKLPYLSRLNEG